MIFTISPEIISQILNFSIAFGIGFAGGIASIAIQYATRRFTNNPDFRFSFYSFELPLIMFLTAMFSLIGDINGYSFAAAMITKTFILAIRGIEEYFNYKYKEQN